MAIKLTILLCLIGLPMFGQSSYCVLPSQTGSGSGADWNNAIGGLMGTLTRGSTYYVGGGTYNTGTFNTTASGSTYITIIKATSTNNLTSTGWQTSYGTNALFTNSVQFSTSYWLFDGATGGGPGQWTNNFGFKVLYNWGTGYPCVYENPGNFITLRHMEIQGNGPDGDPSPGFGNDGIQIASGGNDTNSYMYIHDLGRCVIYGRASTLLFEYLFTGYYEYYSTEHSELASMGGSESPIQTNITFRYSIFTDVDGTGGLMFWGTNFFVYGNVFYHATNGIPGTTNGPGWGYSNNGIFGSKDSGAPLVNVYVYNNVFYNTADAAGGQVYGNYLDSTPVANNNLFYGTNTLGTTVTQDYNYYVSFTGSTTPSETHVQTGSGDPFISDTSLNFDLIANSNPGLNLGTPYNIDANGNTRVTWTRGAFEYTNGIGSTSPGPVQNFNGNVFHLSCLPGWQTFGQKLIVQSKTNLSQKNWTTETVIPVTSTNLVKWTDTNGTAAIKFYRVGNTL